MALNETSFEYADRGATSVYKFRFELDPVVYVWFEYGEGAGSLHRTPRGGSFRAEDPIESTEFESLESLLAARGTSKAQWVKDLMAQFGEPLAWTYP